MTPLTSDTGRVVHVRKYHSAEVPDAVLSKHDTEQLGAMLKSWTIEIVWSEVCFVKYLPKKVNSVEIALNRTSRANQTEPVSKSSGAVAQYS
jgi:hypothetical protein